MMNSNPVVAVDLGGTNLRAAKIDHNGRILKRAKIPTPSGATNPTILVKAILNSIRECAGNDNGIEAVAVVVPGSIDVRGEIVVKAPHLSCLNGFGLKQSLAGELGVKVILENDANAAAVGENWLGGAQGCHSVVCLTLGTGIGAGIILNGKLWRGADGSAGEIGHTTVEPSSTLKCECGNNGCLELFTSATGITRMAKAELALHQDSVLQNHTLSAQTIYEAALQGDALAEVIFKTVGTYLGVAIANLMNVLNPEIIVIGGGVANAWSIFESTMREEVQRRAFSSTTRIVAAACGDDAGVLGAARLAMSDKL